MSYLAAGMPPVVRITNQNADGSLDYQLESQGGTVVATYTGVFQIDHPASWWDDMRDVLVDNFDVPTAAHDMIRMNAVNDWELIDERGN